MGFDRHHEPPEELRPATRAFGRLCACLTGEAGCLGGSLGIAGHEGARR
jgi:hypothetical protein